MGLFDTVLFLDGVDAPRCAQGHPLRSFQTKDFDDPSMHTYLVHDGRLYRARDDLKQGLRARGVHVLEDDEPLALAHREIQKARQRSGAKARRRGRGF